MGRRNSGCRWSRPRSRTPRQSRQPGNRAHRQAEVEALVDQPPRRSPSRRLLPRRATPPASSAALGAGPRARQSSEPDRDGFVGLDVPTAPGGGGSFATAADEPRQPFGTTHAREDAEFNIRESQDARRHRPHGGRTPAQARSRRPDRGSLRWPAITGRDQWSTSTGHGPRAVVRRGAG